MSCANVDVKSVNWFIVELKKVKSNIAAQIKNLQSAHEKALPEWYDAKYKRLGEIIFAACEKLINLCYEIDEFIKRLKRIKCSLLKYVDKSLDWLKNNQGNLAAGAISFVIRGAMQTFYTPPSLGESMLCQELGEAIQSAIDGGAVMSEIERLMAFSYLSYGANPPQFIVGRNGNLIPLGRTEG